jgi:hypothetical protein
LRENARTEEEADGGEAPRLARLAHASRNHQLGIVYAPDEKSAELLQWQSSKSAKICVVAL